MSFKYPQAEALGLRFKALFASAHNPFPGSLTVDVIINPASGMLLHKKAFIRRLKEMDTFLEGRTLRNNNIHDTRIHVTLFPRHAAEISKDILSNSAAKLDDYRLVVSVGGDGTHQETLENFLNVPAEHLKRFCFFRFPMGTGNDGADCDYFYEALTILYNGRIGKKAGALRIKPKGMHPFYAFNIASLGIDAYVTFLTNKLKGILPGDVYKIIADVSTLFYEPIYKAGDMRIVLTEGSREVEFTGRYMLFAVGVSGRRCYGDHKWVLPGSENVCAIERTSLKNKLKIKKLLYQGKHGDIGEVGFHNADFLTVYYPLKVPMQMDGEAVWLSPESFPLTMEVLSPRLPILESG